MRKEQQLHGNAVPARPLADVDAIGIVYLNLQRSGLYLLDCREWEMRSAANKTMPNLRTAFAAAERCLRTSRGIGVPQGLANNLEDLQRAMEGLTEATALERTSAAADR